VHGMRIRPFVVGVVRNPSERSEILLIYGRSDQERAAVYFAFQRPVLVNAAQHVTLRNVRELTLNIKAVASPAAGGYRRRFRVTGSRERSR